MRMLIKIFDLTTLCLGLILGTRVLLKILGASVTAPFVRWIYLDLSEPLMSPFQGIFPAPAFGKNGIVDIPAFFALVVYLGIGYLLSAGLESFGKNLKINNVLHITKEKHSSDSSPKDVPNTFNNNPTYPQNSNKVE